MAFSLVGGGTSGSSSPPTTAPGTTAASGSTFVICMTDGGAVTSVTDNKGNTYTQVRYQQTDTYGTGPNMYYCQNGSGGAGHTATVNSTTNNYNHIWLIELTGVLTSGVLDTAAGAGANDTVSPYTVTSGTLAQADNIVLVNFSSDASTQTASDNGSGFTLLAEESDGSNFWTGGVFAKTVSSTSAATLSMLCPTGQSNVGMALAVFKLAGGGGGTDVALTGVESTGDAGTVGPANDQALTGNTGTGAVGTAIPTFSKALTNVVGTGGVGTVGKTISLALGGVEATGDVGSIGSSLDAGLSGVEGAAAVGNVTAASAGNISLQLAGVEATGDAGTMVPGAVSAITGNVSTGSVGTLVPTNAQPISGAEATGSVGDVTANATGSDITLALSGVQALGEVGQVVSTGGTPDASSGLPGIDIDLPRRKHRHHYQKPILQRMLEKKAEEAEAVASLKPKSRNAKRRAKAIEAEAAQLVLDTGDMAKFEELAQRWMAEQAGLPPMFAQLGPMELFQAQMAGVMHQQYLQAMQEAEARRRQDDEDSLLLLLLA